MKRSIAKKIIPLAIAAILLSTQALLPLQAEADNKFLNYDNPNANGNNPYKLSLKVVTPQLLTSIVSCTGIENKIASKLIALNDEIQKGLDKLLKKAKDKITDEVKSEADRIAREKVLQSTRKIALQTAGTLAKVASVTTVGTGFPGGGEGIIASITDIPYPNTTKSTDTKTQKKLDQAAQDKINADAKLEQREKTETCLNGIAVGLAKSQLTAMTKYTMNWINSGFNGNPFFVRNVSSFMNDVSNEIVRKEIALFKDPNFSDALPYGRNFAQGEVNTLRGQNNFQITMKQDLTDYLVPGATIDSFATNFSQGGKNPKNLWGGWERLTMYEKNNPLGFTLKATEYITRKQNTAVADVQAQRERNGGFLDDKKCVEWQLVDEDGNPQYNQDWTEVTTTTERKGSNDICVKEETVTPGSTIKAKIDTYVNTPERQLELVRTMDDALNSLFAALLSKFENQGLSSLRSGTNNFVGANTSGFSIAQAFNASNGIGTPIAGSFIPGSGSIDLTKDLGNTYLNGKIIKKGIIQTQQDYLDNLKKLKALLPNIIPALGKLDYCIPGPNENWESNSQDAIATYLSSLDVGATTPPPIDPNALNTNLTTYKTRVDDVYGVMTNGMQDPSLGNGSYLKMAAEGLALTKDLVADADTIATAKDETATQISESISNIAKLNAIKVKVNAIIVAAQQRRAQARAAAGLPVIKAACLATETVTYLDNGIIK
jgi:hypothetical protein